MDIQTEIKKVKMELGNKTGRPKKAIAEGRVKLTTSMQSSLVKWFKKYAIDTGQTLADVLESAANQYKYEKERNK
jgi:hypothetical protein